MPDAIDPFVDLVINESADRVRALVDALLDGRVRLDAAAPTLQRILIPGPRTVERVRAALKAWAASSGERSESGLAVSLLSMLSIRDVVERRGPACELVWTGAVEHGSRVRATAQAVDEMLRTSARSVLVISYSVYFGMNAAVTVLDRLAELARSGVDITLVVDAGWNNGLSIRQVTDHWPVGFPRPHLYSFTADEDSITKLHAKVLLVDRRDILVTSANLTGHGMLKNLEFGLRVRGQPAVDAADHFDALLRSGSLDVVDWP